MDLPAAAPPDTDLALAFELAPVGLCVLRRRMIQRCNGAFAAMFGYTVDELGGRSMAPLYPSDEEFRHIGCRGEAAMREGGYYSDERIMRARSGRLFWCHAAGRSLDRSDPFGCAVWMFEDISARRPISGRLTAREREVAQLLAEGLTSKLIARALGLSPRTIDAHRARLARKLHASTPAELVSRLLGLR